MKIETLRDIVHDAKSFEHMIAQYNERRNKEQQ